jgi:hypothetical protein
VADLEVTRDSFGDNPKEIFVVGTSGEFVGIVTDIFDEGLRIQVRRVNCTVLLDVIYDHFLLYIAEQSIVRLKDDKDEFFSTAPLGVRFIRKEEWHVVFERAENDALSRNY